jgi:Na+-transporting methylmalonyl-CoA/oxaloacetate decarboxylase gamma subunit
MYEERTGKCLRHVEHIRGHLWHIYSIAVNQVMVVTVNPLKRVLSVFLFFIWLLYCLSFSFSFGYCIVCLSLFHLAIVLSVFLFFIWLLYCLSERQTIQWPNEKEKDRQYNGQMKKRKTDNTMAKWKRERQTIQSQMKKRSVFLFFIWLLYCLSFSFSFGYCIVCLSLFHLAIVLSVFLFFIWPFKWKRERQTIQ